MSKAVTYRSDESEGPTAGTETADPLEVLARVLVHIPDKGHVTTRYYGWYANRPRGMREMAEPAAADGPHAGDRRSPRGRTESPVDPRTVRRGRHAPTGRGPAGPLSITPTPDPRAGTFGVRGGPTNGPTNGPIGATRRSRSIPAPHGPRSGGPASRASGAEGTPPPVCRSSRGR